MLDITQEQRDEVAAILEAYAAKVATNDEPRDLDVALDAILCTLDPELRFKLGDEVQHVELGVSGVVIGPDSGWISVHWSDGSIASCRPSYLELVRKET